MPAVSSERNMYQEYFGLNEAPFSIAPNPQYLYMSDRYREALAHLLYGVENDGGGFTLLTGEVGTGKTTICRCMLAQLPEEVDTAFIIHPKLSADELLASTCDDLGIDYPASATTRVLVDRLNKHLVNTIENGRRTLLIIDEAQNLSEEVLEQLRLLTNLETNQRKLLQIILLGQPELMELLSRKALRQLSQRITARYHLEALNRKEIKAYIAHRLSVAGARGNFFKPAAMRRVYHLSKGIPRVINLICDRALLGAFTENKALVTPAIVNKAASEVLNTVGSRWIKHLALATVPVALASIIWFMVEIDTPFSNVINDIQILSTNEHEQLISPSSTEGHGDQRSAFNDLFALWGYFLEDQTADPCQTSQLIGLSCLNQETGGLVLINQLNRPAIIKLNSTNQWVTISRISRDTVTLIASDRGYDVDYNVLDEDFDGSFTLLWQPPPDYTVPISPGDSGVEVDWLVNRLAHIDNSPQQVPGKQTSGHVFDEDILDRVKQFQRSINVPVTGIIDPEFYIHLNNVAGTGMPFLNSPHPG